MLRPALTAIVLLALIAFVGPLVSRYDPLEMIYTDALQGPSRQHLLGTDQFGRDLFTRLTYGLRTSLGFAVISVFISSLLGTALGTLAGYSGGWLDNLLMRPLEVLMAFPVVLLAITVIAALGTGQVALTVSVIAVYTPIMARVARATILKIKSQDFVQAALALGATAPRVVLRHVLPNALGPIVVQTTVFLGLAILLEAALSFLGLGIQPPAPSLGLMLSEGRQFMVGHAWVVAFPGLALVLSVMCFNIIGNSLAKTKGKS